MHFPESMFVISPVIWVTTSLEPSGSEYELSNNKKKQQGYWLVVANLIKYYRYKKNYSRIRNATAMIRVQRSFIFASLILTEYFN